MWRLVEGCDGVEPSPAEVRARIERGVLTPGGEM